MLLWSKTTVSVCSFKYSITKCIHFPHSVLRSAVTQQHRLFSLKPHKMSDQHKKAIAEQIAPLATLEVDQIISCIEEPKNKEHADLAFPVAKLNKFKKLGNPAALASEWATKIVPNDLIKSASAAGPYLNFLINKTLIVAENLNKVFAAGETWGNSNEGQGKTVVVEFSSPNMAKPFHAGHLRSTIIGNFLKNLHKALGYNVVAINYLGDWGKQYGVLAVGFEKYGNETELEKDPIHHLYDVYVKINKDMETDPEINDKARAYFKRMEDGDKEAIGLWKRFRDLSIKEYIQIYKRLNVEFDEYSGESLQGEGMIHALNVLEEKKLLEEDKNAKLVNLEAAKLNKVLVKKSDGTTLYITRDISAAASRKDKYKFSKMFYVVASQQDLHFQQLFKILELMGYNWNNELTHINFGMVKGMSTRKGTAVFLEDILNEAQHTMLQVMRSNPDKFSEIADPELVADLIGLSAVVIQDFSAKRIKDYEFNWSRMTNFEGDTGPYLQYQHARLCSMERKAGVKINKEADLSLLTEPAAQDIAQLLGKFPDVVKQAQQTTEACTVVAYLFELAHAVSAAHNVLWVKDREQALAEARMALFWAARITLGNGLRLLGLVPLERM